MANSSIPVGVALFGGLVTVLSPCVLPVLPILVGRSLQSHRLGPLALVAGLVAGFAVAGSLIGITATWIAGFATGLRYFAIALLLGLGVLTVFPQWSYRFWSYLPIHKLIKEPKQLGLAGEFWIGTQLGLIWTPCAGSVLAGILVLAAVHHQVLQTFGLLLAYGVGSAIPLLAIAYGGRTLAHRLLKLRAVSGVLQRVGGILILLSAIAILMGWDIQIQLWLLSFS